MNQFSLRARPQAGLLTAVSAAVLFYSVSVAAQPDEAPSSGLIRTDRYTLTKTGPTEDQVRPLAAVVNIAFAPNVRTVGEALQELLQGSGYRLVHHQGEYGKPVDQVLMHQPLPATQYRLGPMTLRDVLSTLGGPAWHLQVNEFGREVWYELDARYEDDPDRIRRLLSTALIEKSPERSDGKPSASEEASTYIEFHPGQSGTEGLTGAGQAELSRWLNWYRKHEDQVRQVSLVGESQSTAKHARASLAEARAAAVAGRLVAAGVPVDRMTQSSVHKNHASENRQGVYLVAELASKPEPAKASSPGPSGQTQPDTAALADPSVVESPDLFRLHRGEDLEAALRRWASKAQYNNVVWNVRNEDGQFVRIPIRAEAVFRGDLKQSLAQLKEAYATAPRPLYLDIELREGNKIVYVELLHYGD